VSDRSDQSRLVWHRHAVARSGLLLLLGLIAAVLAVSGASHVDGGPVSSTRAAVAASHDHGSSCHEAGHHDSASAAVRTDRGDDPAAGLPPVLPAAEPAPLWTAPVAAPGDTRPACTTGGRAHLVLAQISRT
jgi:hypothetical protein